MPVIWRHSSVSSGMVRRQLLASPQLLAFSTLAKTRIMSDANRHLTFVLQRLLLKILITRLALSTLCYEDNREDIVGKLCLSWNFR